jgi:hypothetical protein
LHMPTVTAMAKLAQTLEGADLRALGGDLFHPAVLLAITALNVYKPTGLTPYGWRKQREQRRSLQASPRPTLSSVSAMPVTRADARQPLRLSVAAAGVGYFVFHFAQMGIAMMLGMAIFIPFSLALTALGYTALLDASSIDFQVGMGAFMVAPMVAWMRVRGCGWRDGVEMGTAMLLPVAVILGLRNLGLLDTLPWLVNSEHTAMFVGMLVVMLYRRERFTSGYSFIRWPSAAATQTSSGARLAEAEQPSAPAGPR